MKQLKTLAILSVSFNIIACGPKPTICISNPKETNFRCYNYDKGKSLQKTLKQADGMTCLSPVDSSNELEACKLKHPGPQVNACIVSSDDVDFHCFDVKTQSFNLIPWSLTENYVCTSPQDHDQLLTYCKQLGSQTNLYSDVLSTFNQ